MAEGNVIGFRAPAAAKPLISVITNFLDAERYLAEAIESVLAQTWPAWELVLVDDGSTDGSTAIARDYTARHPGVLKYVEHAGHANRGMSASRNVGASHARGEWLAFLDADDVFLPEKLERQAAVVQTHLDVDAVIGDSLCWYSWTSNPGDARRDAPRSLHIPTHKTLDRGEILPRLVRGLSLTPATCSVLVRRTAFDRIGGFEESFRGMHEDQAFFYKLFLHCRTRMAPGILDKYRQHADSCCAVASRAGDYDDRGPSPARRRFLDWFAAYLRQERCRDARLRCLVEVERWLERYPAIGRRAQRAVSRARRAWAS